MFERDAGLAALVRGPRGEALRERGRVVSYDLPRGTVEFDWLSRVRGWGLIVLDGFLTRQVRLGDRATTELVGRGDVIRPWEPEVGPVPMQATWRAVAPSQIGVLDSRFMDALAGFPEVTALLSARIFSRARRGSVSQLLARLPWTEGRILVLFWHLAEQWGRALPDGDVLLPVSLTHVEVGEMVGAGRPTTTMALNHLIKTGALSRHAEGWVLHGSPPSPADLEREALAAAFRVRRRR